MLRLMLPQTADYPVAAELQLEHSLVSVSKWESIHEKPFFGKDGMDSKETLSYIEQMVLQDTPPEKWMDRLSVEDYRTVTNYINSKQSATWFREDSGVKKSSEVITSELIYYWMISFQIDISAERWHLNRLMTLIKICGVKQTKPKKMSKASQAEQMRRLNAERREALGTNG
jgi:hypothetical protein